MRCPNCGITVPPKMTSCPRCGSAITVERRVIDPSNIYIHKPSRQRSSGFGSPFGGIFGGIFGDFFGMQPEDVTDDPSVKSFVLDDFGKPIPVETIKIKTVEVDPSTISIVDDQKHGGRKSS